MTLALVHYGEIALKGGNRPYFESLLERSIKAALPKAKVKREHGKIIIKFTGTEKRVKEAMEKIFGIEWFSFPLKSKSDFKSIKSTALKLKMDKKKTFKVEAKRVDKTLPYTSQELAAKIGEVFFNKKYKVSMEPEQVLYIEADKKESLVFLGKFRGLGGLPAGSAGKVVSLLSGGIDSPVSSWLMMKRGCTPIFVHFHPFGPKDKADFGKIEKLIGKLKEYFPSQLKVYLVPFYPFQLGSLKIPSRFALLSFRRFMLRCAEKIADREKALGIVTGESVGQVASQTLSNMRVVEEGINLPVFRPLVGFDKREIIQLAEKVGTYKISLEKYRDCCISIMDPHPATSAKPENMKQAESSIDMEKLVEKALEGARIIELGRGL
ncbi:MAG: tRNA 4-thiouridine(8) synthase ThiI [Candidatus Aenigmarchaeota archaeon]|nr:tRNA 4-thiouridine(8) synthase ThiI [Candidatus Aenigmarchaeota archaeon]